MVRLLQYRVADSVEHEAGNLVTRGRWIKTVMRRPAETPEAPEHNLIFSFETSHYLLNS